MSYNVILTKFTEVNSGEYTEKDSQNIDTTFLSIELYEQLNESYFTLIEIYEENMEEKYQEKIVQQDKLNNLIDEIRNDVIEKMKIIVNGDLSKEDEDKALNEVRVILNLSNIVMQKIEKYDKDKNIMLVVG